MDYNRRESGLPPNQLDFLCAGIPWLALRAVHA
jgi:hypothetical protein